MKNLTKTILTLIAAGLVTTAVSTQEAQAAKINGTIDFSGATQFDSSALQDVTKVVEFRDVFGNSGKSNVSAVTGTFATFGGGIPLGTTALMAASWTFIPPPGGQPALWSVGGFTFNLLSSTVITRTATFLNIEGIGTITGNGFDDTTAKWAFTVANSGGAPGMFFSFSANNSTAVPDGGSAVALLGISLVAIEFVRRKLRFRA
jgi:VPDSG-CTERM motif